LVGLLVSITAVYEYFVYDVGPENLGFTGIAELSGEKKEMEGVGMT